MNFKQLLPHGVALITFIAVLFFMFSPEFAGRTITGGDTINFQSSSREAIEYTRELGERQLWTGTSFSGMPTYQILTIRNGNYLLPSRPYFSFFFGGMAGLYMAGMVVCYIFLLLARVNPWLAIAGSVGFAMGSNNVILMLAGHVSKISTIFWFPFIAAGIIAAFSKRYILGALIFAFGMAMAITANHLQMLYYFGLTVPLYGIGRLIYDYRKKQLAHFGKAVGVLLVGLLLALGVGASNLLPTQEYTPSSMRGGQVLETPVPSQLQQNTPAAPSEKSKTSTGLDWDYAMQWSNSFIDALSTYSPFAAGGGSGAEVPSDTEVGQALKRQGFGVRGDITVPLYHGDLIFTEGPYYLGAVVWALFIFGLFTAKLPMRIWLGGGTLLIMLMSGGKYLETFNRLLFDNLPLLNKFRTPNSALSISTFMMLSLGVLGVNEWFKTLQIDREKARKQLLYSGVVAGAAGAIIALVLPLFMDFTAPTDMQKVVEMTNNQGKPQPILDGLIETRKDYYFSDSMRSWLFVGLAYGALLLAFLDKIKVLAVAGLLTLFLAIDFTGVNNRYLTKDRWQRPAAVEQVRFTPNAADQQILADPDPHFRVLNVMGNTYNDARTSYFHKSIGGYSAVKMRRYQDIIDGYLIPGDMDVLNMLNAKYFIVPDDQRQPVARRNPGAYGPAWLVNDIQLVESNDEEFQALGEVEDLRNTAIVHREFADAVDGFLPSGEGTIRLTNYTPNDLSYAFNSPSEQLVVFSETWYGPNLGWNAYIDGEPAELIRANYILRALRVPAGEHEIELRFEPKSYAIGATVSAVSSVIILLGLAIYLAYVLLNRKNVENTATPTEDMPQKSKKPRR